MNNLNLQKAVFAGGCFWCTEAVFLHLRGVLKVLPGYSGGNISNPTYEQVCSGSTGHTEAIEISFDPNLISYKDLLTVFFFTHDPTTINRQGNDVGTQYRSVIFYINEEQKKMASDYVLELANGKAYDKPIVTEIIEFKNFFVAEDYHQNYYENHKDDSYCEIIISPKIEKLEKRFSELLK